MLGIVGYDDLIDEAEPFGRLLPQRAGDGSSQGPAVDGTEESTN